ncbi:MAG: hypothetical protein LZ173_06015 [Thaumarchaeota archaeon]|nr:hypothetical protein [Candidatus Geocrenenecus arthurdayi]
MVSLWVSWIDYYRWSLSGTWWFTWMVEFKILDKLVNPRVGCSYGTV